MSEPRPTRHGPMVWPDNDLYIGRCLAKYGEFSQHEVLLFEQLLSPGNTVVEAGANIGALTVPIARLVAPGRVYAFEPQKFLYGFLAENTAQIKNVVPYYAALGAREGKILVPELDASVAINNYGSLSLVHTEHLSNGVANTVPLDTIDDLELSELHFLKADVEGMEADVIRGARHTIERCRPTLYFENDKHENSHELLSLVHSYGYRMWWHLPDLFNPDNFAGNRHCDPDLRDIASFNVLALPVEAQVDMTEFDRINGPDDWWSLAAHRKLDAQVAELRAQGFTERPLSQTRIHISDKPDA